MKLVSYRGSHAPVLSHVLRRTSGPVLELGCGMYSTTFIHWFCFPNLRPVVSYETKPEWHRTMVRLYRSSYHDIRLSAGSLKDVDFGGPYEVALVDHSPNDERIISLRKLVDVPYVIIHDTDDRYAARYRYREVADLFKYRYRFERQRPNTSVWSNIHAHVDHLNVQEPGEDIPPDLKTWKWTTARKMSQVGPRELNHRARYTVCRALREVFKKTSDPELRERLRYASTLAGIITERMDTIDRTWLRALYPRRKRVNAVIRHHIDPQQS
jgi:hypothetical protein